MQRRGDTARRGLCRQGFRQTHDQARRQLQREDRLAVAHFPPRSGDVFGKAPQCRVPFTAWQQVDQLSLEQVVVLALVKILQ